MDTIDLRRDPCADAIAIALAAPADEAATDVAEQGSTEPITTFVPGRERPVKYVQHPSYVRFLRLDTLAA
jgi:hypothetical protein